MAFIPLRKSINGFPVGAGDEVGKYRGGEFIITPAEKEWRVIILKDGNLLNTARIPHINAARGYCTSFLEEDDGNY